MPSSNTCRFTALSIAVIVTIASVAVTCASAGKSRHGAVAFRGALGIKPHRARERAWISASLGCAR